MKRVRYGVGLLLMVAGCLKVGHRDFEDAIRHYDLLPIAVAGWVALILPPLEILVGLGLLSGLALRGALLWAELLFYTFAVAQISVLVRGLNVDCGCFGNFTVPVTWAHAFLCLVFGVAFTRDRLTTAVEAG